MYIYNITPQKYLVELTEERIKGWQGCFSILVLIRWTRMYATGKTIKEDCHVLKIES